MASHGKGFDDSMASQCLSCHLKALCLPRDLTSEQFGTLGRIVDAPVRLDKRECLVQQGTIFRHLYTVRTGSFKQVTDGANSETLLTALYLPGDIIGFDAIGPGHYPGTIVA
ncbi:cyclic nucleotide-binding domain-containing protein [Halomonas sp. MCCC 1A11036]|uniref:Cyclic nucleotide-binding domain-containing protein n=1 Tax=Billgrantia zhangzhouensis TaxID=2733481 RepID=A0ABS9AHE3_9GAMM|nr:cyclic nucleotide-binding domain-containing protein [Halomonas zhangzhouensis]MCE8021195.1 cyclic nucleotide-binding domain-containing protein [Halomonas zhangzhouensis]